MQRIAHIRPRRSIKPDTQRLHEVNTGQIGQHPQAVRDCSFAAQKPSVWQYMMETSRRMIGLPRHLTIHVETRSRRFRLAKVRRRGDRNGMEEGSDIWIRRSFELPEGKLNDPQLLLHHDDDVEVYLNGVLAFKAKGYVGEYQSFPISAEAKATLKPGKNVIRDPLPPTFGRAIYRCGDDGRGCAWEVKCPVGFSFKCAVIFIGV